MVKATMRNPKTDAAAKQNVIAALQSKPAASEETEEKPAVNLQNELLPTEDTGGEVEAASEASPGVPARIETTNAVALTSSPKGDFFDVSGGAFEGEFDTGDIRHAQLKIVQGSGPMSQKFQIGALVLGDEELLPPGHPDPAKAAANPLLKFVPVQIKKQFRENISQEDYANGVMPRIANSLAEVEALGGTTQWIGGEKPSWSPSGRVLMLVKRPENSEHPAFAFELDGDVWAPCVFYAAGGSWTAFPKVIFSNQTSLFEGVPPNRRVVLPKYTWSFRAVRKQYEKFAVLQPEVRMLIKEPSGKEVRAFAQELINGPVEAAETGE